MDNLVSSTAIYGSMTIRHDEPSLLVIHDDNPRYPIDGRELHEKLKIGTAYKDWFPRMCGYGFVEKQDFCSKMSESTGGRPAVGHDLTIGMAKEICMLQRTEAGRNLRRYLISVEEQWNNPDAIMERALAIAHARVKKLFADCQHLEAANSELTVKTEIMRPKAEYFDELVERGVNLSFRETSKQLQCKEKSFINFLLDHKYVYRDQKGKLMPYAQYVDDGLFVLKECFNEKTSWGGTQTLVTPKGRETFRLLTLASQE